MLQQGIEHKFSPGRLLVSPGARAELSDEDVNRALTRHLRGDWGEVDDHDRAENEMSLREGFRLLSAYTSQKGTRFWIITEADQSLTSILLPHEY